MAECPFCEYVGSSSSVEAHVSGKSDEPHKGKVGSNYRGIIRSTVGEVDADPDGPPGGSDEIASSGEGEDGLGPGWVLLGSTVLLVVLVAVSVQMEPAGSEQQNQQVVV